MFRTLVIGVSVLLFFALGGWGSALRSADTLESAEALADRELSLTSELLPAMYRLDIEAVRAKASALGEGSSLKAQLSRTLKTPVDYHNRHEVVDGVLKDLKDKERDDNQAVPSVQAPLGDWTWGHPYFIFAVDQGGVCVAHTNNPRCYAQDSQGTEFTRMGDLFPSLKQLLANPPSEGSTFVDIWIVDHKPILVGGSLVRADGARRKESHRAVVGALIVGYPLSQLAAHYKKRLGLDVAFVRGDSLVGSTSLDGERERALQQTLSKESLGVDQGLKTSSGPLGSFASSGALSYIVIMDWEGRLKALKQSHELLIFAILSALLITVIISVAFTRYIEPFKQIDLGLIEVQNGNEDYWFSYNIKDNGISKTISQNLDVIVSRYLGRPEPEFEDDGES